MHWGRLTLLEIAWGDRRGRERDGEGRERRGGGGGGVHRCPLGVRDPGRDYRGGRHGPMGWRSLQLSMTRPGLLKMMTDGRYGDDAD